jgi:hypothetical protein
VVCWNSFPEIKLNEAAEVCRALLDKMGAGFWFHFKKLPGILAKTNKVSGKKLFIF